MATATTTVNVYVAPEDGWKQVVAPTATIQYLRLRQFPCNHGVYVYIGTAAPTELNEPTGFKLDGDEGLLMNVTTGLTTGCWVRCMTPAWGGGAHTDNAKTRIDAIVTTA